MNVLKHTLLLWCLLLVQSASAQVQVTLNVDANPPPHIADWVNRDALAILTVTNTNPALEGTPYRINIRLLLDDVLVAETHLPSVPVRNLTFGTEVFLADEVIPYEAVRLYGNHERTVMQTGMIPAGLYTFCVSLVDLNNNVISSPAEVCRNMFITAYQPPELILPAPKSTISSMDLMATQFVWSPVTPSPPAEKGIKYVVVITEVYPRQNPEQAFFVNYPMVEEEVFGATRMMWPPDIDWPSEETNYAWGVKAVSIDDEPYLSDNAGFSAVGTFTVVPDLFAAKMDDEEDPDDMAPGPDEGAPKPDNDDPGPPADDPEPLEDDPGPEDDDPDGEEPELEEPQPGEGTLAATDTIYAGQDGEFVIFASSIAEANGTFSGEGKVFVGWLNANVEVAFDSITVDDDNRLVTGKVVTVVDENAPVYPVEWGLQAAANIVFSHLEADAVMMFAENTVGQMLPYLNPTEIIQPLNMPLGFNWSGGSQLAITEMAFQADKAEFNAVAALALPYDMTTQRLGFLARNIEFHPNSIQMPMQRLELVEDFSVGNVNNNIVFQFKQPDANNLGCYVEWDDDGFSEYGVQITALFTRDWLLPVPDNDPSQKVSASLSVQGTSWNDLILGGTMDQAEIVDAGGMTILADSIYYDFSDVLNPPGITFPENFPGDTSPLFRGFYMKAFELALPASWQTANPGGQPTVSVQNMIINNTGLTMNVLATNVLEFPDAEIADLYASIDTVHVDIVASSLVEGGIKGRIGLPINKKDSLPNPLQYTALFNNPQLPNEPVSFQLSIVPTGPIPANMLRGEIELAQTSNLVAYVDENKRTFDMNLDGSFNWESIDLGPVKNVQLGLNFQGMGMNYDSSLNDPFSFNIGTWSFASQQKFMANFPVTIQNIGFTSLPAQQNQLIRGKVDFDVVFNLSEDVGGMTGLGVEMAILDNVAGQKFYPQYIGTSLDSIYIQANMAAVNIEGALGIRTEDPVFGNGFVGSLSADFHSVGIQASALAEFGNTTHQNGNELYRYWRVEADVILPPPGVAFLPGMAFRGFGGGAYNNMEASLSGTTYAFTPLKSQLGFQAKASIATTPSEEGFNADATLAGEFNTGSGGLTFINFTGDFWVGAEMNDQSRAEAIIAGDLGVTYNFPDKHFNLFANVDVNAPPITTPAPAGLVLDINGLENQWYFKFGEPANLNTVSVFGVNLYQYLMFGNHIPIPSGFTPAFSNAYFNAVNQYPGAGNIGSGGIGPHTNTGSGFALGIGFMFDHTAHFPVSCWTCLGDYFVGFNLGAGAELHLAFLDYSGNCGGYNPIGINGWRASGGLGFYATAGAFVERVGGLGDKTWNIADLAAGGWIYGEFPNPYYATGAVSGHAYVFDVIDVNFHREFEVGTKCSNQPSGGSVPVTPGDVAADQQEKLIQYVNPATTYNFPTGEPLAVKYGLVPDEVFNVSEQQADGSIIMRTFKMETSVQLLLIDDDGNQTTQMMNNQPNTLGEYLYTVIGEMDAFQPGFDLAPPAGVDDDAGGDDDGAFELGSVLLDLGLSGSVIYNFVGGTSPAGPAGPVTGDSGSPEPDSGLALDFATNPIVPYPPQPPPPNYGDLPPAPVPPSNNLQEDANYQFTVTATLREYVNGSWVNALTAGGSMVTETVVKTFSTGAMPTVVPGDSSIQTF